ncbi:metallophosphoesterase [Deinococcus xinjiangensis]|uniref:metallophosphoesterase n=1 Tax=Deinococcus xinjiangensis TaxID=457454 RepID=UPI0033656EC5
MTLSPIIVPDLHGEYELLQQVLARFPERDYVFLGDLVDRGPDSPSTVQRVLDLVLDKRAILVLGNHEDMWIRGAKYQHMDYFRCWLQNGGEATLKQYEPLGRTLPDHIELIEHHAYQWYTVQTPHGPVLCVHGSRPHPSVYGWADDPQHCKHLSRHADAHLWQGNGVSAHPLPEGCAYSVHGHLPQRQARWRDDPSGKYLLLDTGPVKSGLLSVLDTHDLNIHTFSRND